MADSSSGKSNGKTCLYATCGCCGCLSLFNFGFVIMLIIAGALLGVGGGGSSNNNGSTGTTPPPPGGPPTDIPPGAVAQEFWITHYDPALGGINGRNCGGSMVKVCSDSSSPTGYVGRYPGPSGEVRSNGVIAVPQDSRFHDSGQVNWSDIPVPLWHETDNLLNQARIIIPCYNDNQSTIVGDHFATMITKPNRLDLSSDADSWNRTSRCLRENNLILDSESGYNGGSKVIGYIVGDVIK